MVWQDTKGPGCKVLTSTTTSARWAIVRAPETTRLAPGCGKHRAPVKDRIVAVFRPYESRAGKPLLHDHAVVSSRARRPDDKGTWGNLSADSRLEHIVAAGTRYALHFMEEVSARLGWAWEPREVMPGRRPVMEITGTDQRLIGWWPDQGVVPDPAGPA